MRGWVSAAAREKFGRWEGECRVDAVWWMRTALVSRRRVVLQVLADPGDAGAGSRIKPVKCRQAVGRV